MFKKILFCSFFILIFIISSKQDSNAKTWPRGSKIPAEDIIAAINSGNSIRIDSCEIWGVLKKEGMAERYDTIPFVEERPDTIEGCISISRTRFRDSVIFRYCHFIDSVYFYADSFCEFVSFSKTTFGGNAYFWYSTFRRDALFRFTTFDSIANFNSVKFGGFADFHYATFGKKASFEDAIFDKNADFNNANFDGCADFFRTAFDKKAYFNSATFAGDAFFRLTIFGGDADFMDATFKAKVDLSPKEFQDINISWKQFEGHLVYDRRGNYKLVKHFEEKRQLDDADGVYIFLKKNEASNMKWTNLSKYMNYIMWVTCGYFVMPGYTILWSIGIIVLFALFFRKSNAIKEIEAEFGSPRRRRRFQIKTKKSKKKFLDALYFSFHTFLIGIVSDRYPSDEFLIGSSKKRGLKLFRFRTLSMIEGALGWILVILFIASLGKKFIR
jgi:hypothetical protein